MKTILFISIVALINTNAHSQAKYEVLIGNQTWMTHNLHMDKFRNGETIPQAKSLEEWRVYCKNKKPAWCYYENDPENGKKYGMMYNWFAVTDQRGLAPQGWHIPSIEEWYTLEKYLGENTAAQKMKTVNEWEKADEENGGVNGNNASGFSALPAGQVSQDKFTELGKVTFYWTSTKTNAFVWLYFHFGNIQIYETDMDNDIYSGYSVRCIKN